MHSVLGKWFISHCRLISIRIPFVGDRADAERASPLRNGHSKFVLW